MSEAAKQTLPLALLMARDGFKINNSQPKGRQSAGASFLEAYFRFSGNKDHRIIVPSHEEAKWFHDEALRYSPDARTFAQKLIHWGDAAGESGVFHCPDPGLNHWAWKRSPWGDGSFSLLGIVHTLCSHPVQQALGHFSTSPIRHWDALICTSNASRKVVEGFLERQENWLRQQIHAKRFERPQLPVIPLGIHSEPWAPPGNKSSAQERSRHAMGIRQDAELLLIAGRLDLLTKFQPAPLLQSLEELRSTTHPNLEVLIYGEAPSQEMAQLWKQACTELVPRLKIHWVPGRKQDLAAPVRWAADVFISLADNPQETFGITPLEAMAAELPCLVSDWDGYRDTVVQPGEGDATGYRFSTRLVEGLGQSQALGLLSESLDYGQAVGQLAQGIAVDLNEFKARLSELLKSPSTRLAMGEAGRKRVRHLFDWSVVIEQWRELIHELNQRRGRALACGETTPAQLPPWMPTCSDAYGSFATEVIPNHWRPQAPPLDLERQRLNNLFQSWDNTLLTEQDDARRRGWWLKQGLVER